MPIITMAASNFELRLMFLYFGNFNLKIFSRCSYFTYSISPKYYLQLKCYPAAALGIGSELPVMWVWRSGVMRFTVHHGHCSCVPLCPLCLCSSVLTVPVSSLPTVPLSLSAHCFCVPLCPLCLCPSVLTVFCVPLLPTVPLSLCVPLCPLYRCPSVIIVSVSLFFHCAAVLLCSLLLSAHGTWETTRIFRLRSWSKAMRPLRRPVIV